MSKQIFSYDTDTQTFPTAFTGALNNFYSARTTSVRGQAKLLPNYLRKRALSQLNQAPLRILCVGDSTTAGVYSDSYTTAIGSTNQGGPNSWPSQLAARLNASGVPADYAFTLPGRPGNEDSRWSIGGWGYAGYGAGMNGTLTSNAGAANATVVPGVAADRYIVYYYADSGTGTFTAQATGGTSVTIGSQSTAGVYASAVVSASSASTANVITLANTSGTVFVMGVEGYNSATPNRARVMNAGVGGSKATDWAANVGPGPLNFIRRIAPDLTIISLGINDGGAGAATSDVLTAVQTVAAAAASSGDVVLMSAVPHNGAGVLDGYNAAYAATTYPYVDLQYRYGYTMSAMGLQTTDNTHPNALGYGDMATAVVNLLRV